VTTKQIIEQIKQLSPGEQAEVVRFAYRLDAERQLTGRELSALAKRMVETSDPTEAAIVREAIAHGFYGGKPNA
jgi:predicted outer membrane protein